MPESNKTRRVTICVTEQDYEKLNYLARESCRTIPGYLRWLLHQHFKKPEEKSRLEDE